MRAENAGTRAIGHTVASGIVAIAMIGSLAAAQWPHIVHAGPNAGIALVGNRSPCAYTPLQIDPVDVPTEVAPYTAFSVIVSLSTVGGEATSLCTAYFAALTGDGSITYDDQDAIFFDLEANDSFEYTVYLHSGEGGGCNTLHIRGHDSADYYPEICVTSTTSTNGDSSTQSPAATEVRSHDLSLERSNR